MRRTEVGPSGEAAATQPVRIAPPTNGRMRAHALARAHARTGDAAMIAGYMGSGQTFDVAICEFATEYCSQNRSDYRAFVNAIRGGRVDARVEEQ